MLNHRLSDILNTSRKANLLAPLFDKQVSFITDPSRRKVAVTGRRSGKTFTNVYYLVDTAMSNPGCCVGYSTVTRQYAKELIWYHLTRVVRSTDSGARINNSDLSIRMSNQSIIRLTGCKDTDEADKARGFPFRLFIIDEVEAIRSEVLKYLLEDVLAASLSDYRGTLACTGTPDASCAGYLYEFDKGDHADSWSHHHWTVLENKQFPQFVGPNAKDPVKWLEDELAELHLDRDDPFVRREYFGEWVKSLDDFILHIDTSVNVYKPPIKASDIQYILGIDLGYRDESAFVVTGFSQEQRKVWEITNISYSQMPLGDIIDNAKGLVEQFNPIKIVVDPASGGMNLVEELRKRYGFPAQCAEKNDKATAFRLWNAAILAGNYMFLNGPLLKQAQRMEWNSKYTREREGIKCDLVDAANYSFRECLHYIDTPKPTKTKKTEDELSDEFYLGTGTERNLRPSRRELMGRRR